MGERGGRGGWPGPGDGGGHGRQATSGGDSFGFTLVNKDRSILEYVSWSSALNNCLLQLGIKFYHYFMELRELISVLSTYQMLPKYLLVNWLVITTIRLSGGSSLEKMLTYSTFQRALTPGSCLTTSSDSSVGVLAC